jgi:hypothetical protein
LLPAVGGKEALADLSLVSKRYNEEYFLSEKVGEITNNSTEYRFFESSINRSWIGQNLFGCPLALRCFNFIYIHNPAPIIITMIIKPTKIGASTFTSITKIDSITSKTIIPIITSAIVPKAK